MSTCSSCAFTETVPTLLSSWVERGIYGGDRVCSFCNEIKNLQAAELQNARGSHVPGMPAPKFTDIKPLILHAYMMNQMQQNLYYALVPKSEANS